MTRKHLVPNDSKVIDVHINVDDAKSHVRRNAATAAVDKIMLAGTSDEYYMPHLIVVVLQRLYGTCIMIGEPLCFKGSDEVSFTINQRDVLQIDHRCAVAARLMAVYLKIGASCGRDELLRFIESNRLPSVLTISLMTYKEINDFGMVTLTVKDKPALDALLDAVEMW